MYMLTTAPPPAAWRLFGSSCQLQRNLCGVAESMRTWTLFVAFSGFSLGIFFPLKILRLDSFCGFFRSLYVHFFFPPLHRNSLRTL